MRILHQIQMKLTILNVWVILSFLYQRQARGSMNKDALVAVMEAMHGINNMINNLNVSLAKAIVECLMSQEKKSTLIPWEAG